MQQIITFFNTENPFLCSLFTYLFAIIEYSLLIFFVKTLFNLKFDKPNFLKSILPTAIIGTLAKSLLPLPFNLIPVFLALIFFLKFCFKISFLKSSLGVAIFTCLIALLEYIINLIVTKVFVFNILNLTLVPNFRILFSFSLYFSLFFIIILLKFFNSKIDIPDDKNILKLIFIVFITSLIILPNYIFLTFLDMNLPNSYVAYNIVSAFLFFLVGLYSTNKINKLQITKRELETANLYNSTLSKLVDSNRAFKHDINNIFNSIGGFIELNDMDGLKDYYDSDVLPDIKKSNNLSLLNPDVINSPPLFGLFLAKYNYADSLAVKVELNSFFDYSTINMNIFDFVKIFGILFDNSIEAASKCDEKIVSIYITIDFYNRKQVFKISNSYLDKDIDINKIFDKNFSTKEIKSGFGLWEVKQLLKKYPNVKLLSSKDDSLFTQKLEIYF